MIFKSYILEQSLREIGNYKIFLFYGENQGLKKEFKDKLKKINQKKELINLTQNEILKNKNLLVNEISNKSLFNEEKVIFINEVNDKILELLEETQSILNNERIFLFSEVLEKKSKLRNFFEKSKNLGIVPCYQDNIISIRKIIANELSSLKGLNNEIINFIIETTGLDRDKVNNEIEKIKICFNSKEINRDKIEQLLNTSSNNDFNLLKDEAIKGNKVSTNKLLADTVFEAENNIYYLNTINQRINKLNEIIEMKKNALNIETLITSLKPPIFWKDKPIIIDQSKKWNKDKIKLALKKIYEAEIKIKSNSSIRKDLLIKNLIIDLCTTANSA